jgi:DnaK suppressor protein
MKKQKTKNTEHEAGDVKHKNNPQDKITDFNRGIRYSDKELNEFKDLILTKLSEARIDYDLLKGTLSRQHDHGTDDTCPTFKLTEDAADIYTKEEVAQLAVRQQKFIEQLQNALIRIENKTYGICKISGKLIAKERLKSVPHTTMSIDAKLDSIHLN